MVRAKDLDAMVAEVDEDIQAAVSSNVEVSDIYVEVQYNIGKIQSIHFDVQGTYDPETGQLLGIEEDYFGTNILCETPTETEKAIDSLVHFFTDYLKIPEADIDKTSFDASQGQAAFVGVDQDVFNEYASRVIVEETEHEDYAGQITIQPYD